MCKLNQVFSTLFRFTVCYQMDRNEGAEVLPARRHETRKKLLLCCISRAGCGCSVSVAFLYVASAVVGGKADRHHTLFSSYQVIS